jgi:hypothetical protein
MVYTNERGIFFIVKLTPATTASPKKIGGRDRRPSDKVAEQREFFHLRIDYNIVDIFLYS